MSTRQKILLFILVGVLAVTIDASAKTNQPLVIKGSLLIDGTGNDPIKNGMVVINEGKILEVGSNLKIPNGSKVITMEGSTILPGFFNAHVHEAQNEKLLQAWAREGITTVRDLAANPRHTSYTKRDLLNKNPLNARLVCAGEPMSGGFRSKYVPVLIITTIEEARFQANRTFDEGADLLKLMIDSSFNSELMPEPVAKELFNIANSRGKRVTTHIRLTRDIQTGINVGVTEFAHMVIDPLTDDLIKKIVDAGIYITPTIEINQIWGAEDNAIDNLRRFVAAGGKVVLGTDFIHDAFIDFDLGMPMKEIQFMQEAGMTPMQIIVAATMNAAVVCNLGSKLGTLEKEKIADILVIDGDPLDDLKNLKKVLLVIKEGVVIRQ